MRRSWIAAGVGAFVIAGVATWLLWPTQAQPVQPAREVPTFDLNGSVILHSTQIDYWSGTAGEPCTTKGGYRDLAQGAPVTVYNGAGTAVATGSLDAGKWFSGCMFTFTIPNVPESPVVQVEVSHRGKVPFSLEGAKSGKVDLTLG